MSGKLDRRALPAPAWGSEASPAEPPASDVERLLVDLFAEVLGVAQVGPHDGFFELGGDSIVAIQLVSRARREGLRFTPRQVFQHRTVAALARVVERADGVGVTQPDDGVGPLPLTPVMEWYRQRGGPVVGFVQSVLLQVPAELGMERLTGAVQAVLDHHEALRMRLADESGWRAEVAPVGSVSAADCVRRVDVSDVDPAGWVDSLAAASEAAAGRLAPADGLMVQVVWFDAGAQRPGRLLFLAHHLVVDLVSWRILVPDLMTAWQQPGAPLPPVGTSYRRWAEQLVEQARRPEREDEADRWLAALDGGDPQLGGRPLDPAVDTVATAAQVTAVLPAGPAGRLLTEVTAAFHCGPDEVMLTALALAVTRWRRQRGLTDEDSVLLDMEGHGREGVAEDLDLSRTVGWFTSIYPVRLRAGRLDWDEVRRGGPALGDLLKRVKEQLRGLPDKGAGFGLLRYLNPRTGPLLAASDRPQIGFNYLGRFGSSMVAGAVADEPGAGWAAAPEQPGLGGGSHPSAPLAHVIEINAFTMDGPDGPQLQAVLGYPSGLLDGAAVRELADAWVEALTGLVQLVDNGGAGGHTPSDFPLVALSVEQLEQLELAHADLIDVLPLAPLQEGLLFHAVHQDEASGVYLVQFALDLEGPLDAAALRRATADLLERHPNLKAGFRYEGLPEPVQVIPGAIELPWREVDLSGLAETEQAARMEGLVGAYRAMRFDPTRPPMLRFLLVRFGPDAHRLLMTTHHILIDGWSSAVLLGDLMALYEAAASGQPAALPPVRPFGDYLAWVRRQSRAESHAAWRRALSGLPGPTKVVAADPNLDAVMPVHLTEELPAPLTSGMRELARTGGLTVNTIVEVALALTLREFTGRSDVVFGVTVSGRPPEVEGMETMVGLFINTVPVRVRLEPDERLAELLERVQQEQAQLIAHQHVGLGEIQRLIGMGELFDTALVFENYPLDTERITQAASGVRLTAATGHDTPHFPLGVAIMPDGEKLAVRITHRPDLIDRPTAERIVANLRQALECLVGTPDRAAGEITLSPASTR